jgi:chemotaxis protein MotB
MAVANRHSRRSSIDIWPGFVDALAQLLMVIIFILLIFTAGQFYLSEALSGRDQALKELQQQVSQLADLLALERQAKEDLQLGAARLASDLKTAQAERDELTTRVAELAAKANEATARANDLSGQLAAANTVVSADKDKIDLQLRQIESLQRDIAALQSVRQDLEAKVSALAAAQQQSQQAAGALRDRSKELAAQLASEQEKTLLAQKQIDANDVKLRDLGGQAADAQKALAAEKAVSQNALAQVEQLNAQIAALRDQLQRISAALDLANAKVKTQQGQITDLGKRLNMALVNKVEELARYRSEFFGRLRDILGDRPGIRVVGDRFVFQSEVLFAPGSAELDDDAKKQLMPVIDALKDIAAKIPPDINWLLEVQGHTDHRPIDTPQFPSNWELSTARAISVVRFAMAQGIPPERVAAAGYADTQPLDPGSTPEAYRRNRRIELKLTERDQ